MRDRLIASSPCVGIKLPAQQKRLVIPLTLDQVQAVSESVGDKYQPLVVLGAGAGLRVGEALGLVAGSVDFLGRTLTVTRQAVTVRRVTTLAAPKTTASVRTVPLADAVLTELASWLQRHPRSSTDLLVSDAKGDPVPQNRFSMTWARAVARAR